MIQDSFAILAVLLTIEGCILFLANHPRFSRYFDILPSVFWIYFLPMLASSVGLIDPKAAIYSQLSNYLLPMALFLLLITVDIKAIFRLGGLAVGMFFIGTLGIMLGLGIVFVLFKGSIGSQFAGGFAALSGSWTGGSANMIAVKEALAVPDQVFLPMVIVDTIVPYVWMAIMVACVSFAPAFDKFNHADRKVLDDLNQKMQVLETIKARPLNFLSALGLIAIALIGGLSARYVSYALPEVQGVISTYAWGIIAVSVLGILISLTPVRRLESYGTNKVGYFLLYLVLTSIGARASITHIGSAFILIAAGFLVVLIHALVLLAAAKVLRAPLFLAVVASQANVGGVASAPVVAEIYQKGFASVGLLLAILGNIEGTYVGILMGQILNQIIK